MAKSENVASPMATGTPTIINGQLVSSPAAAPATPASATTLQVTEKPRKSVSKDITYSRATYDHG